MFFHLERGLAESTDGQIGPFLNIPDCLDHFGVITQSKLPRPTLYLFPFLLDYGGIRGPTMFHSVNMGLKYKGVQDLLRGWCEGVFV